MRVKIGQQLRFEATFKTAAGDLIDPDTVKFAIKDPDNNESIFVDGINVELVRESLGVYYCLRVMNKVGRWVSRFISVGVIVTASDDEVTIVTGTELSI